MTKKNKNLLTFFVTIFIIMLIVIAYVQIGPQFHSFIDNIGMGNMNSINQFMPHIPP